MFYWGATRTLFWWAHIYRLICPHTIHFLQQLKCKGREQSLQCTWSRSRFCLWIILSDRLHFLSLLDAKHCKVWPSRKQHRTDQIQPLFSVTSSPVGERKPPTSGFQCKLRYMWIIWEDPLQVREGVTVPSYNSWWSQAYTTTCDHGKHIWMIQRIEPVCS